MSFFNHPTLKSKQDAKTKKAIKFLSWLFPKTSKKTKQLMVSPKDKNSTKLVKKHGVYQVPKSTPKWWIKLREFLSWCLVLGIGLLALLFIIGIFVAIIAGLILAVISLKLIFIILGIIVGVFLFLAFIVMLIFAIL